jgi:hypothetical protein
VVIINGLAAILFMSGYVLTVTVPRLSPVLVAVGAPAPLAGFGIAQTGGAVRDCGCACELSMRQAEVARTIVFDQPRNGRAFFEALVADNLDLGCPNRSS